MSVQDSMRHIKPAANDGALNLILLAASLVGLLVLRWLTLKAGYAL